MKRVVGIVLVGISVLSAAVSWSARSPSEALARSCYSIWAEADAMGSHYRHIVYVENDCDDWLQCSVWTDVDPQPPKLFSVAPGAVEHAETNGRSDYDDPRGFGACHRK
jgi:hypothetical protein